MNQPYQNIPYNYQGQQPYPFQQQMQMQQQIYPEDQLINPQNNMPVYNKASEFELQTQQNQGYQQGQFNPQPNQQMLQQYQPQQQNQVLKASNNIKRQILYPREEMNENNEQMIHDNLQSYLKCQYCCGECCGSIRTFCVCLCCIDYPYKQIEQSYQAVYERFGKYIKTVGAGLQYINICTDRLTIMDTKTQYINLEQQWCLTKDNIEVRIDAVVMYQISVPKMALYNVENIQGAILEMSFATIRAVIGHYQLQEVLEKRKLIQSEIQQFVDQNVVEWGVIIDNIVIKDIILSDQMQESLSAVAKEKRLAEGKIISAKADVQSAKLFREAADILDSDAAMQIRYLDTIATLGKTSKVILYQDDDTIGLQTNNQNQKQQLLEEKQ